MQFCTFQVEFITIRPLDKKSSWLSYLLVLFALYGWPHPALICARRDIRAIFICLRFTAITFKWFN
jgi:hypothetical protein